MVNEPLYVWSAPDPKLPAKDRMIAGSAVLLDAGSAYPGKYRLEFREALPSDIGWEVDPLHGFSVATGHRINCDVKRPSMESLAPGIVMSLVRGRSTGFRFGSPFEYRWSHASLGQPGDAIEVWWGYPAATVAVGAVALAATVVVLAIHPPIMVSGVVVAMIRKLWQPRNQGSVISSVIHDAASLLATSPSRRQRELADLAVAVLDDGASIAGEAESLGDEPTTLDVLDPTEPKRNRLAQGAGNLLCREDLRALLLDAQEGATRQVIAELGTDGAEGTICEAIAQGTSWIAEMGKEIQQSYPAKEAVEPPAPEGVGIGGNPGQPRRGGYELG